MKRISNITADLGLLTVTVFWGTTFILSKIILTEISLFTYLAIRLCLAAFFMILISLPFRSYFKPTTLLHGIILGTILFLSYFFQMWGIQFTSATNAGFITALNVVFVPIFLILFFKDKPKPASLVGVVFATVGLFLLSGGDFTALNKGDWLVFLCAITVTFHVIYTGIFAPKNNIYLLTAVQLSTTALLSLTLLIFNQNQSVHLSRDIILILIYLALFGTVYTFLMQTSMQRFTTPTRTALVFTMEPVFAFLFAYLIAGEMLSPMRWLGGIFILLGMITAEINWQLFFNRK
jgi:drug/metabolite transporter (DMT)-like permease